MRRRTQRDGLPDLFLDYDNTLVPSFARWFAWCRGEGMAFEEKGLCYTGNALEGLPPEAEEYWRTGLPYAPGVLPFPGAVRFVRRARRHFRLRIVTFDVPNGTTPRKAAHALLHFGIRHRDVIAVPAPYRKHVHTAGGILVDDLTRLVEEHVAENRAPGVAFNFRGLHPWCTPSAHLPGCYCTDYDLLLRTLLKLRGSVGGGRR